MQHTAACPVTLRNVSCEAAAASLDMLQPAADKRAGATAPLARNQPNPLRE
jgi:hypothetical protein